MNNVILKYLRNKGYDTVSTDYYKFIDIWETWWKNQVEFHKYHDQTGKERKMFSLGMAKRLAEDWSSILFTERDEIATEAKTKEQTEVNNKYLNKISEDLTLKKLKKCKAPYIKITHSYGTIASKIKHNYPKTTIWLRKQISKGYISKEALIILNQLMKTGGILNE